MIAGATFGAWSTWPTPAAAFRTARELPSLASNAPVAFVESPIAFRARRSFPRPLEDTEVQAAVWDAALAWAEPSCSAAAITFFGFTDEGAQPGDGINTVEFITDWETRGHDTTAPGFTDVQFERENGGQWSIAEADVYLNSDYEWSVADDVAPLAKSLRAVLTHEFGHVLGLLHPCEIAEEPACTLDDDAAVTMFPVYSQDQATLAPDDVAGICYLYPAGDCSVAGCSDGEVCRDGACVVECGEELCARGTVCTSRGCRYSTECLTDSCVGQACSSEDDCGRFERCVDGTCRRGPLLADELCEDSAECAKGVCFEGTCHDGCLSESDCMAPKVCTPLDDERSICEAVGLATGATCDSPLECAGGHCLEHAKPEPLCTQACGENLARCPGGWACGVVDAEKVCIPIHAEGGGCALEHRSGGSSSGWLVIVLMLGGAGARALRRRSEKR